MTKIGFIRKYLPTGQEFFCEFTARDNAIFEFQDEQESIGLIRIGGVLVEKWNRQIPKVWECKLVVNSLGEIFAEMQIRKEKENDLQYF